MLPSPNLDDRTFEQIRDEAVRLIPQYCPEWTNFNPSDPGVTLIELFSWMTEMVLYRLNRVPDKVYLTLLDLIGIRLRPPQPSRAILTFHLVDGFTGGTYYFGMGSVPFTDVSTAQQQLWGFPLPYLP